MTAELGGARREKAQRLLGGLIVAARLIAELGLRGQDGFAELNQALAAKFVAGHVVAIRFWPELYNATGTSLPYGPLSSNLLSSSCELEDTVSSN